MATQNDQERLLNLTGYVLNDHARLIYTFTETNESIRPQSEFVQGAIEDIEWAWEKIDQLMDSMIKPYGQVMIDNISTLLQMSQQDEKACVKQSKHVLSVNRFFDQYAQDDHARLIFEIHLELSRAKMQLTKIKNTFDHLSTGSHKVKKPNQFERIRAMRDQLRCQIDVLSGSLGFRVLPPVQSQLSHVKCNCGWPLSLIQKAYL